MNFKRIEFEAVKNEAVVLESFGSRAIGIGGDMAKVISDLSNGICKKEGV